jgi:hypothetical protein
MAQQKPDPQDDRSRTGSSDPQQDKGGQKGGNPAGPDDRGQAARDEARLDRDQVRDDPREPHDESRLG